MRSVAQAEMVLGKRALLRGLLSLPLLLILLLFTAFALERGWLAQGREGAACAACLLIGAFASGKAASGSAAQNKLLYALVGEAPLLLFTVILGILTKDAAPFNMSVLIDFLILIFGAFLSVILSVRGRRKKRR